MPQNLRVEAGHDLLDLVRTTLASNPYLSGRDLVIECEQGNVVIRGAVRSWYHKQVAQESVRRIRGISGIRNELEVVGA